MILMVDGLKWVLLYNNLASFAYYYFVYYLCYYFITRNG